MGDTRRTMNIPILLILGPSGAGKTTLADLLERNLNFLHINFDRQKEQDSPQENGVDKEGLRKEWDVFLVDRNPQLLVEAIRARIQRLGRHGATITCPSGIAITGGPCDGCRFSKNYLAAMKSDGINCVVLYGTREECLASFLSRIDGLTINEKNERYWTDNNGYWHTQFDPKDFDNNVLHMFYGGQRRPDREILDEIRRRI